ncbi:MAG: sigma-70 family RNA polymerase sigma factor [bacterium]
MAIALPDTSVTLLARLRDEGDALAWQISWKRFVELYHQPLMSMAGHLYRVHSNGLAPSQSAIEDVVAGVVVDFYSKNRFNPARGRLRTYLRLLINARVVDLLRKEKPLQHESLDDPGDPAGDTLAESLPAESTEERESFQSALLATLVEDLRGNIPHRHFEIFELVKLKGRSPEEAAAELGVQRGVIDNTVYKVTKKLREIAAKPEYQEEYYA